MPYWHGMLRHEFEGIRGYDEDLTGICSDDNDLVDRLHKRGLHYNVIGGFLTIHLYHPKRPAADVFADPRYKYNRDVVARAGDTIERNVGRKWGVL